MRRLAADVLGGPGACGTSWGEGVAKQALRLTFGRRRSSLHFADRARPGRADSGEVTMPPNPVGPAMASAGQPPIKSDGIRLDTSRAPWMDVAKRELGKHVKELAANDSFITELRIQHNRLRQMEEMSRQV